MLRKILLKCGAKSSLMQVLERFKYLSFYKKLLLSDIILNC